jgi:hypothetical protein
MDRLENFRNCILMFEESLAELSTEFNASSLTLTPSHASLCSTSRCGITLDRRVLSYDSSYDKQQVPQVRCTRSRPVIKVNHLNVRAV